MADANLLLVSSGVAKGEVPRPGMWETRRYAETGTGTSRRSGSAAARRNGATRFDGGNREGDGVEEKSDEGRTDGTSRWKAGPVDARRIDEMRQFVMMTTEGCIISQA